MALATFTYTLCFSMMMIIIIIIMTMNGVVDEDDTIDDIGPPLILIFHNIYIAVMETKSRDIQNIDISFRPQ